MANSANQQEYHERFAAELIERIEQGTAPWQKPWEARDRWMPENLVSGKAYRGRNSVYLAVRAMERGYADNRWATFQQTQKLGGHVRRGEHGEKIVFFAKTNRFVDRDSHGKPKRDAEGKTVYRVEERALPYWRTYTVFNAEQTAGLDLTRSDATRPDWHADRVAEAVIATSGVSIQHQQGDHAYYQLDRDRIVLPTPEQFPDATAYYCTALHELGHATGHPDRMDRQSLQDGIEAGFGSPAYAKEELRAEISAMMTGQRLGVGHRPQHGAAYVASWVRALEDDPQEIHRAAAEAQRISNYLIEPARERIHEIEREIADHVHGPQPEHSRGREAGPERSGHQPSRSPGPAAAPAPSPTPQPTPLPQPQRAIEIIR